MKFGTYTASIVKGTNRLVSTTSSDFGVIKPGSYVKFNNENTFYQVIKSNNIYFIKDFVTLTDKSIEIKGDLGIDLLKGDELILSYKEYEVFTLFGINNPGKGYKKGEIVYLDGGALSVNLTDNVTNPASFEIISVNENGGITQLAAKNNGIYIELPAKVCRVFSHGDGDGAILEVEYQPINNRKTIDRTVVFVDQDHVSAYVHLDYPLPQGIKQGKLSLEKYEILLNINYPHDTKIEAACEICNSFTPTYGYPLMVRNTFNTELLYNQTVTLLDANIKSLQDQINDLKKELAAQKEKKLKD